MIRIAKISHEGREWNAEPFPPRETYYKMMSVGSEYLLAESREEWEEMRTEYLPPVVDAEPEHPVLSAVKSMTQEQKQELLTYLNLNQ